MKTIQAALYGFLIGVFATVLATGVLFNSHFVWYLFFSAAIFANAIGLLFIAWDEKLDSILMDIYKTHWDESREKLYKSILDKAQAGLEEGE